MMNWPHPHSGMPMHSPAMHPGMRGPIPYGGNPGMGMKAGPSVVAIARGAGEFGTLLTALDAAGLTGLLEGDGPYTLLAPTDAAFKKLPPGALQELLGDKAKLVALLKYHVVPGRVSAAEILQSKELKTASGQPLPTKDLSVIRADVPARNGMIQVLDAVLLPSG
jgi:uncharacterized surface protein with fasciclin (FAS1) repeats